MRKRGDFYGKNKSKGEKKAEVTTTNNNSNGKTIAIAVPGTMLGCLILMFAVLALTGVIKFGNTTPNTETTEVNTGDTTNSDDLVENTYKRVAVNRNLVETGDLEFYLPKKFESGNKTKDGAYTYNLVDDDGWAQVLVYAENSSLTPSKFLLEKSPYLDITDTDYEMNGTSWVQGETGNILAYATKLDGKVYAVIYTVKLDSDTTSEAMSMIPKTLYMKRIYQK